MDTPSQVPNAGRNATWLNGGFFAPTIRFHNGEYYLFNVYLWDTSFDGSLLGAIYKTKNPFDSASWSEPLYFTSPDIDCDLFWDDDGTVYLHTAGIRQQKINLDTGDTTAPRFIWNGSTELRHRSSIARSRDIRGPYESNPSNPILTNSNTTEYFQTVGDAEFFQDSRGKWLAMALGTRSGPEWEIYPMGRETVLTSVTWDKGEWPILSPVHGTMSGWTLPPTSRDVPGIGPFAGDPDNIIFPLGSSIPSHFIFNRYPTRSSYTISPPGHPNTLRLTPSRTNLTGILDGSSPTLSGQAGLTFVGREQEHTLFTYSVDLLFNPQRPDYEAGVTAFLTQANHIDLSIGSPRVQSGTYGPHAGPEFRFRIETTGTVNSTVPSATTVSPVPASWLGAPIRLQIRTVNATYFAFSAAPAGNSNAKKTLGVLSAIAVSGETADLSQVMC